MKKKKKCRLPSGHFLCHILLSYIVLDRYVFNLLPLPVAEVILAVFKLAFLACVLGYVFLFVYRCTALLDCNAALLHSEHRSLARNDKMCMHTM